MLSVTCETFVLSGLMLSGLILNVVMLSVVAPKEERERERAVIKIERVRVH